MSDIVIGDNRTQARVSLMERWFRRLYNGEHTPLARRNGGSIPLEGLGIGTWC